VQDTPVAIDLHLADVVEQTPDVGPADLARRRRDRDDTACDERRDMITGDADDDTPDADTGLLLGLLDGLADRFGRLVDVGDDAPLQSFTLRHPRTEDVGTPRHRVGCSDDGTHLRGTDVEPDVDVRRIHCSVIPCNVRSLGCANEDRFR